MKKTAIIIGATGLTGSALLQKLIEDSRYDTIKLFSRKKIATNSSKVVQFTGDLINFNTFENHFMGDEVYCCIGTTAKKTPDKNIYKKIDYGIPVAAAKLAKKHTIKTFIVISSIGANANSSFFYTKTKGEMEQAVTAVNIENTYILQPSIIAGNRKEKRVFEKISLALFKIINPLLIGNLKKYKIIHANDIAQAMINLANNPINKIIIPSNNIQKIANTKLN